MATDVLEIVEIPDNNPDNDDDEIAVLYSKPVSVSGRNRAAAAAASAGDDEISVLYSTQFPLKKGATKSDAIPVENYRRRKTRTLIDLSQDFSFSDDDEEVKLIHSPPKARKFFFRGESSNSKNPPEKTEPRNPLIFMCEICADEKPISDAFRVLGCDHSYCTECISKYVASKLQDNITAINCPVSGCRGFFEPQHCRFILPKQVFDRWGDALCEAVILGSERFYCPYKDCSALLIDDSSKRNEVILQSECPDCNRLFCVQCKVPWHAGIVCAEFQKLSKDERSNEDIMLMNLAKSNRWIRCPKCKFYVSKSAGCLFMRCRCGHTFCYNCGAEMNQHLHYCTKCKH